NLPSSLKMTSPRYQDIPGSEIPEIGDDDGTRVRVICGEFSGKRGPVDGIAADPRYLDVSVPAGRRKTLKVETERHAFAYVFEGSGTFRDASRPFGVLTEKERADGETMVRERNGNRSLVLFDRGDEVTFAAKYASLLRPTCLRRVIRPAPPVPRPRRPSASPPPGSRRRCRRAARSPGFPSSSPRARSACRLRRRAGRPRPRSSTPWR